MDKSRARRTDIDDLVYTAEFRDNSRPGGEGIDGVGRLQLAESEKSTDETRRYTNGSDIMRAITQRAVANMPEKYNLCEAT